MSSAVLRAGVSLRTVTTNGYVTMVVIQSKSFSGSYGVFTEAACAVNAPLIKISV